MAFGIVTLIFGETIITESNAVQFLYRKDQHALDFLEAYPQKMKEAGDLSQVEFLSDFKDIEHYNIEINMVHGLDAEDYFAIGHSGCGDYYLMEIGSEDPSVILWNHETGELEKDEEYSSIEEFAGEMLAVREIVQNTLRKKPWWKLF